MTDLPTREIVEYRIRLLLEGNEPVHPGHLLALRQCLAFFDRIAELEQENERLKSEIQVVVADLEKSIETLECGHPLDCLLTTVETKTQVCGWCQSIEIQRDAIHMERELKQQLADRDATIAALREMLCDSIKDLKQPYGPRCEELPVYWDDSEIDAELARRKEKKG